MQAVRKKKPSFKLQDVIIEAIQEKKGVDLISLDLRKINDAICDHFIICHGNSSAQIRSIAEYIEEHVKELVGENPWHREGYGNREWLLIDYVDTVVHIFNKEKRYFYNLEELWSDGKKKTFKND